MNQSKDISDWEWTKNQINGNDGWYKTQVDLGYHGPMDNDEPMDTK